MQRRVSIIKFGNRFNGRPLGAGTLTEVITNIMNSLPDFDQYYNLYNNVSVYNENRLNPLAIESILTFLNTKLGFVTEDKTSTLENQVIFTTHDIYSCIKGVYNKQVIPSERREAIKIALDYFVKKLWVREVVYKTCTTKNYHITGENYLKIMEEYSKLNTKDENNERISLRDLKKSLRPYFDVSDTDPESQDDEEDDKNKVSTVLDEDYPQSQAFLQKDFHSPYEVDHYTKQIAKKVYKKLMDQIDVLIEDLADRKLYTPLDDIMKRVVEEYITRNMCETISLDLLTRTLKGCLTDFDEKYEGLLKERYERECTNWITGDVNYGSDRKVRKLREFEVVEESYTDLTPLEDGRLLAEIVERKIPEDEIDEEDYWADYKRRYDNNMKIRNEKLDKLFLENKRFYARTNPEVSQTASTQENGVLSSNDDVDDIPF